MLVKTSSDKNRPEKPGSGSVKMPDREQGLSALGVTVGLHTDASGGLYESGTGFSAYGIYTPVTIRSHTVRTDHASLESNQSRN